MLFRASIRDNIRCGGREDDRKMKRLCEELDIYDEIMALKNGFETVLGDNGEPLSRGQRQRLSLCRALFRDGDVYLFDEPMSALDPRHRLLADRKLRELSRDKVVLVVTHEALDRPDEDVLRVRRCV